MVYPISKALNAKHLLNVLHGVLFNLFIEETSYLFMASPSVWSRHCDLVKLCIEHGVGSYGDGRKGVVRAAFERVFLG
jgi:hypothetical protein